MFKVLKKWWNSLGETEAELARQGIYTFTGYFGQSFIIRDENDRQETNKRTAKKSKRQRSL